MDPQLPAYNIDWVFSTTSNVSAAKDKEWFTDYHEFTSTLNGVAGGPVPVNGIGTVTLPLKKFVNKGGYKDLILHNVLHAPDLPCNIVCARQMLKTCEIQENTSLWCIGKFNLTSIPMNMDNATVSKFKDKKTGVIVGLLECPKLPKLRLKGQAAGLTCLDKNATHSLSLD